MKEINPTSIGNVIIEMNPFGNLIKEYKEENTKNVISNEIPSLT
jgi:hypothetical protein